MGKYYIKKPKRTEEEEKAFREYQSQRSRERANKHYKENHKSNFVRQSDEERKLKQKDASKRYYDKIKGSKEHKPRPEKKIKEVILKSFKTSSFIVDAELKYEIIISQAKGKLSKKGELMLIKLATKLSSKMNYFNASDRYDCMISGVLTLLEGWQKYNYNRYDKAFPYFTELCKRAMAKEFNLITGRKDRTGEIKKIIRLEWM